MHQHAYGPSSAGSVVLRLGGDVGALIIEAGPDRLGAEIEISPADGGARTHSMVRERLVDPHPCYHAVYPDLSAGRYHVWQNADSVAAEVEVLGGQITWHAL
ncbi:MAG TPA: hypothetical protein VGZ32_25120 [Actinocrinis sp.]|jgi:hypothetical protein|uniref:hypothetical protein n=1 Tax=Actinocrinis sp. TaxID=1920516 RepID=UPI002DDD97F6|nr:hypothetical protein [Actinocrinis sp.]HEV3173656.1 hypothetical protein [Actinocrinis sp.]